MGSSGGLDPHRRLCACRRIRLLQTNDTVNLGAAIDEMEAAGASLLISTDFNGLNSGVALFKNTSWSHSFLNEAKAARAMLAADSILLPMPLKYENRAYFYLMDMWPKCAGLLRPGVPAPCLLAALQLAAKGRSKHQRQKKVKQADSRASAPA